METQYSNKETAPKLHVGFFFLSLGFLISLITTVISFLNLSFSTLDKRFPDALNSIYTYGYSTYDYESMRTALATLIIFFPVLITVAYFWHKHTKKILGSIDIQIKKWLTYIVLFLSSLVVAINFVTLIRYFVSGEITNRFLFKVLITLIVALFVGTYFIFELIGKKKICKLNIGLWSVIKSVILVILLIVFSFSVMGSPKTQRLLRLDERRINDLQGIQYAVINFWQQKEKLPANLKELSDPISSYSVPFDPEFEKGLSYEYTVKSALSFELCATFALPIQKGWRESRDGGVMPMYSEKDIAVSSYPYPGGVANESWSHETGRTCFERTIDPDMYPPFNRK